MLLEFFSAAVEHQLRHRVMFFMGKIYHMNRSSILDYIVMSVPSMSAVRNKLPCADQYDQV